MTSRIATQVIQAGRFGNSYLQIGQMSALSSISIAQDGHSFVFKAELFVV